MPRAPSLVLQTVVVVGGLLALQGAAARDRDGVRPLTNSFVLVTAATATPPPTRPSPNGAAVPASRPVVANPYQVPLLQNAGSLRAR
ncbi:MAG TPA: hypothetical protein VFF43_06580 [Caldimonas sp.]|nr:hypothetical protein [Caldimonas sp.]